MSPEIPKCSANVYKFTESPTKRRVQCCRGSVRFGFGFREHRFSQKRFGFVRFGFRFGSVRFSVWVRFGSFRETCISGIGSVRFGSENIRLIDFGSVPGNPDKIVLVNVCLREGNFVLPQQHVSTRSPKSSSGKQLLNWSAVELEGSNAACRKCARTSQVWALGISRTAHLKSSQFKVMLKPCLSQFKVMFKPC